jgi:hypothetical protein
MVYRSGRGRATCPNFLADTYSQVYYARSVVYFVAFLATAVAFCMFQKRTTAGKKLLGLPYLLALLFFIITYALDVLTQTLQQCGQANLSSFYSLQIVITIFYGMGYWSLLVVVVWTLTSMLRERLDRKWKLSRAICLATVVFMGLFTCVNIGLQCYNLWLNTMGGLYSRQPALFEEQLRVGLAYWVLYLASILVAGALVLLAMQPVRSKHASGGALQGCITLMFALLSVWCLITIIEYARQITGEAWELTVSATLAWVSGVCLILSMLLIIVIARNAAWNRHDQHQVEQYATGPYGQPEYNY